MNVGRNLSYESAFGWSKVLVNLNWRDLVQLVADKKVDGYHLVIIEEEVRINDDQNSEISVLEAYKVLQAYCDILAWTQLATEGGMPVDYVKERLRDIRNRVPNLHP